MIIYRRLLNQRVIKLEFLIQCCNAYKTDANKNMFVSAEDINNENAATGSAYMNIMLI